MARRSYKQLATDKAKALGVNLDDEGAGVEIWTFGSGWCFDPGCHTNIPQRDDYPTEAALWKYIYEQLGYLEECNEYCTCKEER